MATVSGYTHAYVASVVTLGASASVGDVIIAASMAKSTTHSTCTITGATATMTERRFDSEALDPGGVTILTGLVTGAGTPILTFNSLSDQGVCGWIESGLSSEVPDASGGNSGAGSPLVTSAALVTTHTCTFFYVYLDEAAGANFTSFTDSAITDNDTATHEDASGHITGLVAGTYSASGVNGASSAFRVVSVICLPETSVAATSNILGFAF